MRSVVSWLKEHLSVRISKRSLYRYVRAMGFRYKPMRTSCKHERDAALFAFFKKELGHLHGLERAGEWAGILF